MDSDCAVVCVYLAQFKNHFNSRDSAFQVLKDGKCNGRVPKILIKIAYQNWKERKSNLFDGVPDPWDDALHDVTDTSTITNNTRKAITLGMLVFLPNA